MKHSLKAACLTLAAVALALSVSPEARSQRVGRTGRAPVVTAVRVAPPEGAFSGPVYATVGGRERKIADDALKAWVIEGGRKVVYSGRDGAGGFENEGQSLHAYDPATGARRKVMSEYFGVDEVTEVTTRGGRTALLVEMSDGGLGASYFAVVDPARGEVFFRRWARVISRRGDTVVLGHYRESDWDKLNENAGAKVTPARTEHVNLNAVLRRRVIHNKRAR